MKNYKKILGRNILIIMICFLDVILFTYISRVNRYKNIANTLIKDNSIFKSMDLDNDKYDDVIYTALEKVGNDELIDRKKALDEEALENVRKQVISHISEHFQNKLFEEDNRKSVNVHIKVTSYMYYSNVVCKFVESLCLKQFHIDDNIYKFVNKIYEDARYFPIAVLTSNKGTYPYDNSWGYSRNYGGNRTHEGTDIMYSENIEDVVPIVSVCDGIIIKKGWLELGGYRLLIKSNNGVKFYYAHLSSYASGLEEGMKVRAGQILGYMGNTGYGEEGTKGKFDVHLHFGMYVNENGQDIGINPYFLLKFLDINKLYYK